MGKKSRIKRERKEMQGENAGKMMNDIRKKSKLIKTERTENGKKIIQYFNPTKRMMQMKGYKDVRGQETLDTMVNRYAKYMNANGVTLKGENNEG